MKVKRGLFDVGFWALAVWVMVLGQWALVIGNGIDLGCSDNDVHTATTGNITANWSVIDHPLTNGNPDAIVFVTQNWNPGGLGGTYNDAAIGVYYHGSQWTIFNQYESPDPIAVMPEGASFNFKVVPPSESVFIHTATAGNITSNWTVIDHPLTNGNLDALLFVEQNWNPGGGAGTYNDAAIGVWYDGAKWTIFNQDISSMPVGADFNVKVVLPCESAFVHMATVGNIVSFEPHRTVIDHPMANGNPDAILLVTQNWNPGGAGGTYNSAPTGVWYNGSQWEIFNQDFSGMSVGAAFNVTIVPTTSDNFVHINTPASGGNTARIDNTLTNGNPDALLFVTQNWNPGGIVGTYNDSSIGVWYNNTVSKWGVFNQDLDLMPENASFNVKVATASDSTFVHTATISNSLDAATLISHPLTDGHPEVLIFVTQNWNPGGSGGMYNNSPMLVSWNGVAHWLIYNENNTDMTRGAAFNIMVVMPSESAFIHTATVGNIGGGSNHSTFIDHPMTNGNPNARLLVTRNQGVGAGHAVNNSPVAVWYNGTNDRWEIFNQNITAISSGATFNVMVLTECELGCVPCTCDEVDYNGDGIVNLADYARLAEAWLEHELLVDLAAPSAIVDEADLEEFMRHWLEMCE